MEKGNGTHEEASSLGWGASFLVQTAEDASGITVTPPSPSPRSSVVFSSKGDTSPLQKLQNQVFRALKGLSPPSEDKSRTYNPEVLTSQKRQWASFQLDALIRLKKEQEDKEEKRRYKAQTHLYTVIKVARGSDLLEQMGKDMYFDLVDHEKVHSFRIQKQMLFNHFKIEDGDIICFQNFIRTSVFYNPKEGIGALCYSIGDLKHVEA
uniref:Uncharacterized protein n=1 Tax=Lactuca sativa TaxID=4236 RepID=A0A9R1XU38_LACSA|nr:hypothetical protein LSAT_V11C100034210 [Lactuca sativa]